MTTWGDVLIDFGQEGKVLVPMLDQDGDPVESKSIIFR